MDNRWHNHKNAHCKKRHTLHSIGVGLAFFCILCIAASIVREPLCPFKRVFGIDCFGCGMTRGFIAILQLDFISAFQYNPLSIPVFVGIIVYAFCSVADSLLDKDYVLKMEILLTKTSMFFIYVIFLAVSVMVKKFF